MDEKLRPIPGYDRYFATAAGEIYSTRYGDARKLSLNQRPNKLVQVTLASKFKSGRYVGVCASVGRLVLSAFLPPPSDHYVAQHLDGDKANNALNNLAWILPGELRKNLSNVRRGTNHYRTKLSPSDVQTIRARIAAGEGDSPIAKCFGVSAGTINAIRRKRTWKHLSAESPKPAETLAA